MAWIELDWTWTYKLRNAANSDLANGPALLCGLLPTSRVKFSCGLAFLVLKWDIKSTANTAINTRRCFKMRFPTNVPPSIGIYPYDSYTVTCR